MDVYHTYCLKIIAGEHLPRESRAEAFLTRCLIILTSHGIPRYKIDKVVDPAGDKGYESIKAQLLYLRNRLFANRLIHFSESIPDVELNITGRDEELCSPLIRLSKSNAKVLKTVRETLYRFIIEKKTNKSQSLDAFVCNIVKDMLKDRFTLTRSIKKEELNSQKSGTFLKKSLKDKILSQKMTL
jgi:hypothetical protein